MEKLFDSYKGIIEFAIGHEVKAYQLYTDLSKKMVYPEVRELCEELAKEELEHRVKLEKASAKRCELISPVKSKIASGLRLSISSELFKNSSSKASTVTFS